MNLSEAGKQLDISKETHIKKKKKARLKKITGVIVAVVLLSR
jgi:predicted DNA-binding protein (UPF0251 family)